MLSFFHTAMCLYLETNVRLANKASRQQVTQDKRTARELRKIHQMVFPKIITVLFKNKLNTASR